MKGTSFCSNCGASTTPLTEICPKCGVRVAVSLQEMSWFRRHLNWTVLLGFLAACGVAFVVGFVMVVADPSVSDEALEGAGVVTGLPVLALVWGWVLRRKNRSLWWLLLALFVPFGWIAMFALENRSR